MNFLCSKHIKVVYKFFVMAVTFDAIETVARLLNNTQKTDVFILPRPFNFALKVMSSP